jgi:hypothetical protein
LYDNPNCSLHVLPVQYPLPMSTFSDNWQIFALTRNDANISTESHLQGQSAVEWIPASFHAARFFEN